ncbi:MAG TPA: DUF1998 domain-containing protein, partial [Thermomicrobiales bacterium]|nr:DUF1998 domain-containing protein [Thermomicrobiales bacterium]
CRHCGALLDGGARYFPNLFKLQNVSTKRIERITSDEEERQRQGYQLLTAFRFADAADGRLDVIPAAFVTVDGDALAHAAYAPAATLWRINLGWVRRKDPNVDGFLLDMERATWASQKEEEPDGADAGPDSTVAAPRRQRVVPFVEDTRNALLLTPDMPIDRAAAFVSLQYALKRGIEARYQLEGNELAAELLPSGDVPTSILFYEASEGGAGVLTRLVDEPAALAAVARAALEVCHFDPDTGEDRRHAPDTLEDCEAACYNCLLDYTNQRQHPLLDRQLVKPLLLQLRQAAGERGQGGQSRETQRDRLLAMAESELERRFVRWLDDGGYRLPDRAQPQLTDYGARPDFFYDDPQACVYVDGPYHDFADRQARDAQVTSRLEDGGYEVV